MLISWIKNQQSKQVPLSPTASSFSCHWIEFVKQSLLDDQYHLASYDIKLHQCHTARHHIHARMTSLWDQSELTLQEMIEHLCIMVVVGTLIRIIYDVIVRAHVLQCAVRVECHQYPANHATSSHSSLVCEPSPCRQDIPS